MIRFDECNRIETENLLLPYKAFCFQGRAAEDAYHSRIWYQQHSLIHISPMFGSMMNVFTFTFGSEMVSILNERPYASTDACEFWYFKSGRSSAPAKVARVE